MLDRVPADREGNFRKHHVYVRYIDKINKHLTYQREDHVEKDENPVTAADIQIHVRSDNEIHISNMPWKHEHIWSGYLGETNVTAVIIKLVPDAKPFKSLPYLTCPRTR